MAAVDWQVVKAELDEIDEAWKQARFDSLPHVVEILTSQVPEDAIQTLREQRDAIEDVVNDVVRGYHNGFNRAFHNYSQILKIFNESAGSISGLKDSLSEARKLMGSRNKQLQQLWYRSVTIRHIISLLDQIENAAQVPSRMEKLITEKRYYAAVQLYLQSTSLLDREGIQGVGVLQDVRTELSKLRSTLFFKLVDDLQLHLYDKGEYSVKGVLSSEEEEDTSLANIATGGRVYPTSRRTKATPKDGQSFIVSINHISGEGSVSNRGRDGASCLTEDGKSVSEGTRTFKGMQESHSALPIWLAESTPNEFIESMAKTESPLHMKYLRTLVECLGLLGKVAAAGALLSQKLRPTIHELITAEIKAFAVAMDASRPRFDQVSRRILVTTKVDKAAGDDRSFPQDFYLRNAPYIRSNNNSVRNLVSTGALSHSMSPLSANHAAAQELLESILGEIIQILENHVIVGEMMEGKSLNLDDIDSFSGANSDLSWHTGPDIARATGGYSLSYALTVIQSECQQLICDILRATPDAATTDAAVQTARLASKLPGKDLSRNGASEEGLSFAFRFSDMVFSTTGDDSTRQTRNRRNASGAQEGYGTGAVLTERGIYLIAAIYRPILQFTDKVMQILPPKYRQLGNDGLQTFIENFVKDQFLPPVRVDYRNRVQDALASPTAFRPKPCAGALYEPSLEKGRPVLQGPLASCYLANEVVSWAQAMPKYAADFVEVAHALLERTLERCRAAYTEAVLGSLSSSIVGRSDVENLMRQESANTLLDAAYFEQLGQNLHGDFSDPEVHEVEMEIINLLLSHRPVKQDQLIGDNQKYTLLAALIDSLEFVSQSIERLGQCTSSSLSSKLKETHKHSHHQHSNSVLTAGLGILAEKYQSLSAECLRTLRVEMQLSAIYHLQSMNELDYSGDQDAEEPEEFIVSLTMQIARLDEQLLPYLPAHKRQYIFGGICGVVSTFFIKVLNDMESISLFGISQICRNCIAVEQVLAALSSSNSNIIRDRLERVRNYYELLSLSFEVLITFVSEHPSLYSFSEYSSLLRVNVTGREVPLDAVQRVGQILAPTSY